MNLRHRWNAGPLAAAGLLLLGPAADARQVVEPEPVVPARTVPPAVIAEEEPAVAVEVPVQEESAPAQAAQDRLLADDLKDAEPESAAAAAVVIPEGWVRIAIDTDGDGTFDAVETVARPDLMRALQAGVERRMGGAPPRAMQGPAAGMQGPAAGMQGPAAGMMAADRPIELTGTVRETREFDLAGLDGPHTFARLESADGRIAKLDLGPADGLHDYELNPGDEITVRGRRGMINERPVLMVQELSKGDRTGAIDRPDDRMLKRVRGTVLATRTASFRGRGEDHVIARIELPSGRQEPVILGPVSRVGDLDLAAGRHRRHARPPRPAQRPDRHDRRAGPPRRPDRRDPEHRADPRPNRVRPRRP